MRSGESVLVEQCITRSQKETLPRGEFRRACRSRVSSHGAQTRACAEAFGVTFPSRNSEFSKDLRACDPSRDVSAALPS